MLTEEEIKNAIVLIEVGAKAMSHDKPLKESAAIQQVAVNLIDKMMRPEPEPAPPQDATTTIQEAQVERYSKAE